MVDVLTDAFRLDGKVAVITGTTRGLGYSLAEGLAEAGASIIAVDRRDEDRLPCFCQRIGVGFKRIISDLGDLDGPKCDVLIEKAFSVFDRLDILVNNAGITRRGDIESFDDRDWEDVLAINLTVPFMLSRAISRVFTSQRSGKIINVASMLSFQGGLRVPSYASSKHGVVGLTKSLSNVLAPYGINVNAIAPGFMETDMTQLLRNDPKRNAGILDRIPAGRWGIGEDLKGAMVFMASSLSDYIHGTVLPVDGGWLSC